MCLVASSYLLVNGQSLSIVVIKSCCIPFEGFTESPDHSEFFKYSTCPKKLLLGFGCAAPNPESGHLSGTFCQLRTVSQLPGIRLCATPGDVPLLRLAPPAQNLRSAIHLEPGNCVTQQWHLHKQVRGSEVYRWSLIQTNAHVFAVQVEDSPHAAWIKSDGVSSHGSEVIS